MVSAFSSGVNISMVYEVGKVPKVGPIRTGGVEIYNQMSED